MHACIYIYIHIIFFLGGGGLVGDGGGGGGDSSRQRHFTVRSVRLMSSTRRTNLH